VTWFALRVEPRERHDAIAAMLFQCGAAGIHEDGRAYVSHFATEGDARSAADAVARVDPEAPVVVEELADTDWDRRWREGLREIPVGRLTIAPPWLADGVPAERTIVIDPGMAFGTGDHASTRGALRLLQRAIVPGCAVADLGSGSAVLAIGAAKLGAGRVYAIEVDPDALSNAGENIARNGVSSRVHLLEGDARILLPLVAPVDVIVANIIAPVIVALLPAMGAALVPRGRVVVAGILEEERDKVAGAAQAAGWRLLAEDREDGWWSALAERD
jgi:ribosomal protein L11 methyltransferase